MGQRSSPLLETPHLNYISSNQAGTNRTTQAEISNLLRHSFPGRVSKWRSHIFNGLISGEQVSSRARNTGMDTWQTFPGLNSTEPQTESGEAPR